MLRPARTEILKYVDRAGRAPFERWFARLRDESARLLGLGLAGSLGLAGDTRSAGAGVFELRVHIGPGYRVYFAWEGPEQVVLLGRGKQGHTGDRHRLGTAAPGCTEER